MQKKITISREFGSGGREVGLALAKQLDIPFYDKELVSLVGKNNGLSENILAQHEESIIKGQSFAGIGVSLFAHYQQSISDQIYIARKGIVEMNERPTDMANHMLSIDKKRKKYYEYYTDKNWGDPTEYHLCINATAITTTDAADIITIYAERFVQEVK